MNYILDLAKGNPRFADTWEAVKEEGIEDG
jgi:hypothetical protein